MRLLGVDFGFKRIGLATGDTTSKLTTSVGVISASGSLKRDALQIVNTAKEQESEAVVVGLPYATDGTIGQQATICLKLVECLKELGAQVYVVDETLSSIEAEELTKSIGLRGATRRKIRDTEAARIILERFFYE